MELDTVPRCGVSTNFLGEIFKSSKLWDWQGNDQMQYKNLIGQTTSKDINTNSKWNEITSYNINCYTLA